LGVLEYKIQKPKILDHLIEMDLLNFQRIEDATVISKHKGAMLTNIEDTIAFLRDDEFQGEEMVNLGGKFGGEFYRGISEGNVKDYLWGIYLLKLARMKNYLIIGHDFEDATYGALEFAVDRGWGILTGR